MTSRGAETTVETVTGSTAPVSLVPARIAAGSSQAPPGGRALAPGGSQRARAVSRTVWPCSEWRTSSLARGASRRS